MAKESTKETRKGLSISPETHSRFKSFGKYSETQDDILNRLMNIADMAIKMIPELIDTKAASEGMRGR